MKPATGYRLRSVSFFLQQIRDFVPGERGDMHSVLAAISSGLATPDEVHDAIAGSLPPTWSPQITRTHVAGLVGRLVDLGLVQRSWTGRTVHYEGHDPSIFEILPRSHHQTVRNKQ